MPAMKIRKDILINSPYEKVIEYAVTRNAETASIWQPEYSNFQILSGTGQIGTKMDFNHRMLGEDEKTHAVLKKQEMKPDRFNADWGFKSTAPKEAKLEGVFRYEYVKQGSGTVAALQYDVECSKNPELNRRILENELSYNLENLKMICESST